MYHNHLRWLMLITESAGRALMWNCMSTTSVTCMLPKTRLSWNAALRSHFLRKDFYANDQSDDNIDLQYGQSQTYSQYSEWGAPKKSTHCWLLTVNTGLTVTAVSNSIFTHYLLAHSSTSVTVHKFIETNVHFVSQTFPCYDMQHVWWQLTPHGPCCCMMCKDTINNPTNSQSDSVK